MKLFNHSSGNETNIQLKDCPAYAFFVCNVQVCLYIYIYIYIAISNDMTILRTQKIYNYLI